MAGGRVECERVDKRNDPSAEGHAGVDTSVIALWFGHESTARPLPPTDALLAFLEDL